MAAITSRSPLRTQLSGKVGSKSHITLVVCTAAILVIWAITAMFARFITFTKHLLIKHRVSPAMTTSNVLLMASGSHLQAMEGVHTIHEPP